MNDGVTTSRDVKATTPQANDEGVFPRAWNWLAIEPHQRVGVRVLQVCVGLMLLFRVLTEVRFYRYLWGPAGLGTGSVARLLGQTLGGTLDRAFASPAGTLAVLLVLAASACLLIVGRRTQIATLLAFVSFLMLEQRLPELPDGGDNITRIVLIYMLFLIPSGAAVKKGSLAVWFHNLAVLAIAFQIVILYTVSGFMKSSGDKWHHGVAMYYVSQVEWFSLPKMRQLFMNPFIVTFATYVPMFYQLLFGLAILTRLKLPWLAVGIVFHLGVAVFMGLVSFSIAMIGLECFLISDSEYLAFSRFSLCLKSSWNALPHWLARRLRAPAGLEPVRAELKKVS